MLRALAAGTVAIGVVAATWSVGGNLGAAVAVAVVAMTALTVRFLFARFGHAMFRAGRMAEARRYSAVLAVVAWRRSRRLAARVSIAATHIGAGHYPRGLDALARIDPEMLDAASRAGWWNNRAYATLRLGARGSAAAAALAEVRAALALYPEAPALLHTEALALYAGGELEAAIAAWDAMWQGRELSPRLEAERCDDLAAAWAERGERSYAADYRRRAVAAAAVAPWRRELPVIDDDAPARAAAIEPEPASERAG